MREGWHGEDYLVLFDEAEAGAASERYEVLRLLPGSDYDVAGLGSSQPTYSCKTRFPWYRNSS